MSDIAIKNNFENEKNNVSTVTNNVAGNFE